MAILSRSGGGYEVGFMVSYCVLLSALTYALSPTPLDHTSHHTPIITQTYLSNITAFSLYHFEIYRFLLSIFVGNSLISTVFMLLFFPNMGTQMESQMGSGPFLGLVVSSTLITNITFSLCCMLGATLFGMPNLVFTECSGFWTVIFTLITIECLKTPEAPRRMMFIPVDIPSKYFPLALYAFFCLFSGLQLSFAVAIAVGWLFNQGHLQKLMASEEYYNGMEGGDGLFHSASRNTGWIFVQQGGMNLSEPSQNSQYSQVSQQEQQGQGGMPAPGGGSYGASAQQQQEPAFAGRGNTLSGQSGGGFFGGGASAPVSSKEELKAKRLAALEGGNRV